MLILSQNEKNAKGRTIQFLQKNNYMQLYTIFPQKKMMNNLYLKKEFLFLIYFI